MRVRTIIALVMFSTVLNAQNRVRVVVPQNVFIPSGVVHYGLLVEEDLKALDRMPLVYVFLSELNGRRLKVQTLRPVTGATVAKMDLPDDLGQGTYVMSAALVDAGLRSIIEESAVVIHCLGDNVAEYYQFKGQTEVAQSTGDESYTVRNEICFSDSTGLPAIGAWVGDFRFPASEVHFTGSGARMAYEPGIAIRGVDDVPFPALLNVETRMVYPIDTNGIVHFSDETFGGKYQLVDIENGPLDGLPEADHPRSLWGTDDLIPMVSGDEESWSWKEKYRALEKQALVSRIMDTRKGSDDIVRTQPPISAADTEYDLDEYLAFESLELFFKEVASTVKLRHDDSEEPYIRLLIGDNKTWYEKDPALLIDGVLQDSTGALWQLDYSDCKMVRLYRTFNSISETFGRLGRYGIIEIVTRKGSDDPEVQYIDGFTPQMELVNEIIPEGDTRGFFRTLQSIQALGSDKSCYFHGDDTGMFYYIHTTLTTEAVRRYSVVLQEDQ